MLVELAAVHDSSSLYFPKDFPKTSSNSVEQRLLIIDAGNKITKDVFDVSLRH